MSWSSSVPDVQTQRNYTITDLNPSTQEYHDVEQHFLRTLKDKYKVIKISKIHNNDLWEEYSLCKRKMIKQLGANTLNELQLFHGTSQHVIPKIISKGFDWRLCGKNGTAYGKGSYFARDSSTSLKYISGTGHLQMFVASVLTGKAIKGNSSIVHEPEGYNCTVDRENNPKIFVVYHIKQAYPTYLITFEMQIWWTAYGAYLQPVNSVFDALFPLTQDQKNNTASRDFRQQIVQNLQTKDVVVQKTSQVLGLSVTAAEGIISIKSIADSPMPGIAGNLEVGDQILRLNNVHYSTGIDMIAAIRHIQIGDNMVFTIRIQSKEGVGKSLQQARQEAQMKARLAAAKRANEISQPSAKQQQQLQRYQESLTRALARVQKTILQQQSNGRPLAHLQSYQESLTRALADLQQKHLQQQCNARPLECLQRMRLLSSSFKHTQPSMMRSYKLASKRPESENNLGEVASHRKKRRKTAQHQVQIEDGWSCHACTYFNVIAKTICQMCYSPKDKESIGGGWACEACTFDNLAGDIKCGLCDTPKQQDEESNGGDWACLVCTFDNPGDDIKCGLCEAPKQQVHRSGVCIDLT